MDGMRIKNSDMWMDNAKHVLRMLHKYKARDMGQFLDLFDREVLDDLGEPLMIKKCDDSFFERITGILPMFVRDMRKT